MAKGKGNPWKVATLTIAGLAVVGGVAGASVAITNHVHNNPPAEEETDETVQTPETENEAEAQAMATYAEAIANFVG